VNKPAVSIIVPIHKTEKYLRQCVDSLVHQTLENIEIILVNDGSPDNCQSIIDQYAQTDKRITAVFQENAGYGRAINTGLDRAAGEYVGIVESDDWVELSMYEELFSRAAALDADIVKGPFIYHYIREDAKEPETKTSELFSVMKHIPDGAFTVYQRKDLLLNHASIWTAIYKTAFLAKNNIRMLEVNKGRYADQNWRYQTLLTAERIAWLNKPFYNYRVFSLRSNKSSSSQNNNPLDIFVNYEYLDRFIKNSIDPARFEEIKEYYFLAKIEHAFFNVYRLGFWHKGAGLRGMYRLIKNMDYDVIKTSAVIGDGGGGGGGTETILVVCCATLALRRFGRGLFFVENYQLWQVSHKKVVKVNRPRVSP
jgi:glycosyltransferase involved in cell wall biosynthesis